MPVRHLLGVRDLGSADLCAILREATSTPPTAASPSGAPFVAGLLFFESSTRTRVGFEVAVARMGGTSVAIEAAKSSASMGAAETWEDTVRSVGPYFDVMCIRHPDPDAAAIASRLAPSTRVVNCGSGTDEHPTQAVADVAAITAQAGPITAATRITVAGDLRHMRAAHSLVRALGLLAPVTITGASPPTLGLPDQYLDTLVAAGGTYHAEASLDGALDTDVLYMAGFPSRSPEGDEWDPDLRAAYRLTAGRAERLPSGALVLCPLPRVDEIDPAIDDTPRCGYFAQSALALSARVAILRWLLAA